MSNNISVVAVLIPMNDTKCSVYSESLLLIYSMTEVPTHNKTAS